MLIDALFPALLALSQLPPGLIERCYTAQASIPQADSDAKRLAEKTRRKLEASLEVLTCRSCRCGVAVVMVAVIVTAALGYGCSGGSCVVAVIATVAVVAAAVCSCGCGGGSCGGSCGCGCCCDCSCCVVAAAVVEAVVLL